MKTKKLNSKAKNSKNRRWEPLLAELISEYLGDLYNDVFIVTHRIGKVMIERAELKKRGV